MGVMGTIQPGEQGGPTDLIIVPPAGAGILLPSVTIY
jgi:hypothetical protein